MVSESVTQRFPCPLKRRVMEKMEARSLPDLVLMAERMNVDAVKRRYGWSRGRDGDGTCVVDDFARRHAIPD